jgi:SAM-dependent methyltransferase
MSQENVADRLKQASRRAPAPVRTWLLRPPYRLYRRLFPEPVDVDENGLPLPPFPLRQLVAGKQAEREIWLTTGETDAGLIRTLVERNDGPMAEMHAILDFGCGSGRVARWWADLRGPEVFGSDYNPRLTAWCRANLPFMTVETNAADPPTAFDSESFDLVYAISVFTHLPEELGRRWMRELARLLKPGGLVLFTVRGDRHLPMLNQEQREAYTHGEFVVQLPGISGSNMYGAHHPRAYVIGNLLPDAGLELVESVLYEQEFGIPNSTSPLSMQDNYLARKPPLPVAG